MTQRSANRILGALSLMVAGCSSTPGERPESGVCTPNEPVECACPDGSTSTQLCLASGDALGPCACGDAPAGAGGASPVGGAVASGGSVEPAGSDTGGVTTAGGAPMGATGGSGGTVIGGAGGTAGGASVGGVAGSFGGVPAGGSGGVGGLATAGAGATPISSGGTGGTQVPLDDSHCLAGIANYTTDGPFSFSSARSGSVNIWVPDVPSGCKVPIVHLANGTGARCSTYGSILEHLASHGFLTTCYEDTNTGQGTQCLTAIQTALAEYPDLADTKVGSTGHSQGGGGAIMCVYRAEQEYGDSIDIVGHAMEPAHGYGDAPANYASLYAQIRSPIFMFNGSSDSLVSSSWVSQGFNALDDGIEAYWYEAVGAAHIPIPTRWTEESTVAWFRWKLLGDTQACEYFKNMPNTSDWDFQDSQNETECF